MSKLLLDVNVRFWFVDGMRCLFLIYNVSTERLVPNIFYSMIDGRLSGLPFQASNDNNVVR